MTELNEKLAAAREGFSAGEWQKSVNVRDFIQKNYTPYEGDESFGWRYRRNHTAVE